VEFLFRSFTPWMDYKREDCSNQDKQEIHKRGFAEKGVLPEILIKPLLKQLWICQRRMDGVV
jgi:hypothetical protein